jgi:hypothetical protein
MSWVDVGARSSRKRSTIARPSPRVVVPGQPYGYRIRHEDEKMASAILLRILQTLR